MNRTITSVNNADDESLHTMIADYMETGFLDNIIEMLRQDPALFPVIPMLVRDERSRVRLGAAALIEALRDDREPYLADLVPGIAAALTHENPNVRGDAAYMLGIIGSGKALPFLEQALQGEREPVRSVIAETITELSG